MYMSIWNNEIQYYDYYLQTHTHTHTMIKNNNKIIEKLKNDD